MSGTICYKCDRDLVKSSFIKDETSDFYTLPRRAVLWRIGILESSMRSQSGYTFLAVGQSLSQRIIALDEDYFIRRHILVVKDLLLLRMSYCVCFAFHLVAFNVGDRVLVWQDFLSAIIVVLHGIVAICLSVRVEQVDGYKI